MARHKVHNTKTFSHVEICKSLKETVVCINYSEDQKQPGWGSGVVVSENSKNVIFTAMHVIESLSTETKKAIHYSDGRIVNASSYDFRQLKFNEKISIDITRLTPNIDIESASLKWSSDPIAAGMRVTMAGYSSEVDHPVSTLLGNSSFKETPFIVYKSGIVACTFSATIGKQVFDIFYIDNIMHPGASGGAIVNSSCEVVGIIIQQPMTSEGAVAGTTLGIRARYF